MRRKAAHLVAAIAESLRFIAFVFLAFDLGAILGPGVSGILRYAAASQLLFAAGFFFLWLDLPRYAAYRPLLAIGKLACIACLLPLALALPRNPAAVALACFVAAVDVASLLILALAKPSAADTAASSRPGQGPEDIERIEGM